MVEGFLLRQGELLVVALEGIHRGHPRTEAVALLGLVSCRAFVPLLTHDTLVSVERHGDLLAGVAGEGHVYL